MIDTSTPRSKISTPKTVGSWDYWPGHVVGDVTAAHHLCCSSGARQGPSPLSFLFLPSPFTLSSTHQEKEAVITPEPYLLLILQVSWRLSWRLPSCLEVTSVPLICRGGAASLGGELCLQNVTEVQLKVTVVNPCATWGVGVLAPDAVKKPHTT